MIIGIGATPQRIVRKPFARDFECLELDLFDWTLEDLCNSEAYFRQRKDALGELGFTPRQKMTRALGFLAYGTLADQLKLLF